MLLENQDQYQSSYVSPYHNADKQKDTLINNSVI